MKDSMCSQKLHDAQLTVTCGTMVRCWSIWTPRFRTCPTGEMVIFLTSIVHLANFARWYLDIKIDSSVSLSFKFNHLWIIHWREGCSRIILRGWVGRRHFFVEPKSKVARVSSSDFAAVASSQRQSQPELSEDTVDVTSTTFGAQPLDFKAEITSDQ